MTLVGDDDEVVGLITFGADNENDTILALSANGIGKRSELDAYRMTKQAAKAIQSEAEKAVDAISSAM